MADMDDPQPRDLTLGEELRRIRENLGLSLRAVERVTEISNAYLSQLETDKIKQPAPNVLHKLAEYYGTSYETLMEKAGYIIRRTRAEPRRRLSGAALASFSDLTPEEEAELMKYLAFLRSQWKRPNTAEE